MKPIASLLVGAFFAILCTSLLAEEAAPNTLTDAEQAAGWQLLFDGKEISPWWRGYKKESVPTQWVAEDGALVRKGHGGDLISLKEFESFELALDWKISKGCNSGVMFKVQETATYPYETGPEVQIIDNASQTGPHAQLTGWMYGLYAASVDVTKPIGEWNHLVLKCEKTATGTYQCEHWLNGTKLLEYEIGSADWNEKIVKSKFSKWPSFAKSPAGHLCLQDHEGDFAAFRNIKVRVLR